VSLFSLLGIPELQPRKGHSVRWEKESKNVIVAIRMQYNTKTATLALDKENAFLGKRGESGNTLILIYQVRAKGAESWLTVPGHWYHDTKPVSATTAAAELKPSSRWRKYD
jgi:hypothetical protein